MSERNHADDEPALDPELAERLGALPRELDPAHDLWPGVEARLASPLTGPTHDRRVIPLWPALAVGLAAAAALALWWVPSTPAGTTGTTGTTAEIAQASPSRSDVGGGTPTRSDADADAGPAPAEDTLLLPGEQDYRSAAELLAQAIEDRRGELPSELAAVYEDNVGVVDEAIARSRAALARDPEDEQLRALLDDAYRRKLDLLQQVAAIPGRT